MNNEGQTWTRDIFDLFVREDIAIVSYVPDAGHAQLIALCQEDPAITAVPLTTEEEGIPLAAGAYLGGKRSAILLQSSGVGNCINMLSLATTCGFPLLMLVTMRGEWGEFNPWQVSMGQTASTVLRVSGVRTYQVDLPQDVRTTTEAAIKLAFDSYQSVAVLLSQSMVGTKRFANHD